MVSLFLIYDPAPQLDDNLNPVTLVGKVCKEPASCIQLWCHTG